MADTRPKRRRSEEQIKKKKESDKERTKFRIYIGSKAFELRRQKGFQSDIQVALFLLDRDSSPKRILGSAEEIYTDLKQHEELKCFKAFVKQRPPFDIVIDGLNVANTTPKATHSETLLAVVSELERQGLNILVLGRKHMLQPSRNWDRQNMNKIKQKSHCFFTENMSEDDPFLLYAALHSGVHCNFLSRDLMRDHKACLPDRATRRLFFKWQRGHQLVISNYAPGKRVRFQRIFAYDTIVQTSGSSWHIPYDENGDRATYEVPQKWLCLTQEH